MKNHERLLFIAIACIILSACGGKDVVTYAEFRQIQPNMTLADAEKIVGHKGTLLEGQDIDGAIVPTLPGEKIYFWENKDKSNLNIALMYGHVINTAQTGLK